MLKHPDKLKLMTVEKNRNETTYIQIKSWLIKQEGIAH